MTNKRIYKRIKKELSKKDLIILKIDKLEQNGKLRISKFSMKI